MKQIKQYLWAWLLLGAFSHPGIAHNREIPPKELIDHHESPQAFKPPADSTKIINATVTLRSDGKHAVPTKSGTFKGPKR